MKIKRFVFSPFFENTFIVNNAQNECIIIDPGCYDEAEEHQLVDYINQNSLTPVKLINTHCHLDHIFGNKFIHDTYGLTPITHKLGPKVLEYSTMAASNYGVVLKPSPLPVSFLDEGDQLIFGEIEFDIFYTPGHAPDHIVLYCIKENLIISGDVLFQNSIGRTDLPGGDFDTLIKSIKEKLFVLPDNTEVYNGHGENTFIGYEKKTNPFLQ